VINDGQLVPSIERRNERQPAMGSKKKIVVIGAGFGGLASVQGLKNADAEITLIDKRNHHLFQPLL